MNKELLTNKEYLIIGAIVAFICMVAASWVSDEDEDVSLIAFCSVFAGFVWPLTVFVTVVGYLCYIIKTVVNKIKQR